MKTTFKTIGILPAIILILFTHHCISQNLVPNGDFEINSSLPNSPGQIHKSTGWSNLNGNSTTTNGSPDYLHEEGTGVVKLPFSLAATVYPYSGSAIAGLITRHASNFREYISAELNFPMVIGTNYSVSFWITNGQSNQYYGGSSDRIGIRFSVDSLKQIGSDPILTTPQIEISGQVWSTTWINYNFSFTADSAYEYIAIGNFYNEDSTAYTQQISSTIPNAYYFFDKIEVNVLTSMDELNKNILKLYPNPATEKIHISTYLPEIGLAEIFELTGKKVKEEFVIGNHGEINISELENGFYILGIGEKRFKILKQ